MESHSHDHEFETALRTLRPTPRPDFLVELDAQAAAGFPSRERQGPGTVRDRARGAVGRAAGRFRIEPRRLLAPASVCAVAAIAVATAVVAINESESSTSARRTATVQSSGAGRPGTVIPERLENPLPRENSPPRTSTENALHEFSGPASSAVSEGGPTEVESAVGTSAAPLDFEGRNSSGPYASQAERRAIERSAQLVLGTEPSKVRDDAARVFETVHSYDGIVLRSSIRDGDSGEAGATFDLLIPTAKLGDAMAAFSEIGEIRSRHESTLDITAPTVTVGEHLQDARAKVEGLLAQLASAESDAERNAVEAELRRERFRVAALRSRLSTLQRRANLSHVSLRIETGAPEDQGASQGDGNWGVEDAVDDAGHILGVAAGVTVIGLAILAPLALIAFLSWLAHRAWARRSRERALDS